MSARIPQVQASFQCCWWHTPPSCQSFAPHLHVLVSWAAFIQPDPAVKLELLFCTYLTMFIWLKMCLASVFTQQYFLLDHPSSSTMEPYPQLWEGAFPVAIQWKQPFTGKKSVAFSNRFYRNKNKIIKNCCKKLTRQKNLQKFCRQPYIFSC